MSSSFEFPGEYYDIIRDDFRDLDAETSFFASYLPDSGGRVLDLGCGTGTNLRALAKDGHTCVGVDQSRQFLDHAMNQSSTGIQYVHARASEYDATMQFDLIYMVFVTLNYLRRHELPVVFEKIARDLAPGGRFVVDMGHMLNFVESYKPYIVAHHRAGDVLITRLIRHAVDAHQANWRHEESIIVRGSDGVVRMYDNFFDQMVLTAPELEHLLAGSGLRVVERFGGFRKDPPSPRGKGHLVFVVQRALDT